MLTKKPKTVDFVIFLLKLHDIQVNVNVNAINAANTVIYR